MRVLWVCFAALLVAAPPWVYAQNSGTLGKVSATNTITLGHASQQVPFSFLRNDLPAGYMIDICLAVVDALKSQLNLPGLTVKYRTVTGAGRFSSLQDGSIDLECGATTNTAERQQQVAFAPTTFVAATRLGWKTATGLKTLADLSGKAVAAQSGTTSLGVLNQVNVQRNLGMVVLALRTQTDVFAALEKGEVQAMVNDDILLAALFASQPTPEAYGISAEMLSVEPYGIMYRKGDAALATLVDGAIIALMRSGELARLYDKWFTQPIPPHGLNLATPMSPALKHALAQPTRSANPADYLPP